MSDSSSARPGADKDDEPGQAQPDPFELCRGAFRAAGDFKSPVGAFRLHLGSEGQDIDPLIGADVGVDRTPAYRGCAYALFEGLQLADFGNRIPSLTFEILADDEPFGLAAIARDLAGQAVAYMGDEDEPWLAGFAADGADMREATAAVIDAHGLHWREREGLVAVAAGGWADKMLAKAQQVRFVDGDMEPAGMKQRAAIDMVPVRLAIRHHDPERDFQVGIQTAERPGSGRHGEEADLPAALSATDARQLADRKLRAAVLGRTVLRRAMGWAALELDVGDIVSLDDEPGRWLVETCDWDGLAVRLRLRSVAFGTRPAAAARTAGAPVLQPLFRGRRAGPLSNCRPTATGWRMRRRCSRRRRERLAGGAVRPCSAIARRLKARSRSDGPHQLRCSASPLHVCRSANPGGWIGAAWWRCCSTGMPIRWFRQTMRRY